MATDRSGQTLIRGPEVNTPAPNARAAAPPDLGQSRRTQTISSAALPSIARASQKGSAWAHFDPLHPPRTSQKAGDGPRAPSHHLRQVQHHRQPRPKHPARAAHIILRATGGRRRIGRWVYHQRIGAAQSARFGQTHKLGEYASNTATKRPRALQPSGPPSRTIVQLIIGPARKYSHSVCRHGPGYAPGVRRGGQ